MKQLLFVLTLCCASLAHAQSGKVTHLYVGFPPGQATDLIARLLADRLGPALGETVIVENKPGQGGSLLLGQLARMPPDGNSLVLAPLASMVANPHLYRKSIHYDSRKDFEHVAMVADLPLLLVSNPAMPFKSLPEMIAYAKANPDKLTNPSSGNGTLSHLGFEDLKRRAGINILHVPYQGSARAMADLAGGTVQVALDTITVTRPLIQAGRLRLLASAYGTRLPDFADTPTIAEQGFPGYSLSAWLGIVAPAGTPKARVQRLSTELVKIVRLAEITERYGRLGTIPRTMEPAEFHAFVISEYQRWEDIVKASGAKVD